MGSRSLVKHICIRDDAGVTNIYESISSFGKEDPVSQKSLMNLKTAISDLKFNHDGQLLGIASKVKKNAFRLVRTKLIVDPHETFITF